VSRHPDADGWIATTTIDGEAVYRAEHETRDHAMRYCAQAAMRGIRMREPLIASQRPALQPAAETDP
jgi:hypothetical protein